MAVTIKVTDNTDDVLNALKKLNNSTVEVGVFGKGEIAMIARVHEYGTKITVTPKMRAWFAYNGYPLKKSTTQIVIPERSFLRSGYDENINKMTKTIEHFISDIFEKGVDPQIFMEKIGDEFAGLIQKKLNELDTPKNSGMTIERKKSSRPLIDSGRLVGAITHKIK